MSVVPGRQRIRIRKETISIRMGEAQGRNRPHEIQVHSRIVVPCLDAIDVRWTKVLLGPRQRRGDPLPVF